MANENLATYLNDHLAGAQGAIELLEFLEESHQGTDVGGFVTILKSEIDTDRQELKALVVRLNIKESATKKVSAWFIEKLGELKLLVDSKDDDLMLFESLEALSLGIEGKRLLWLALATTEHEVKALQGPDYLRLIERAEDQRRRVEEERLKAARKVFSGEALAQGSSS